MSDNKRLKNYDDLPLVLDVADIRRIMGISRVSAYELVHTPGFPAFRSGRLIKVSKKAFFDWMEKGTETVPKHSVHTLLRCLVNLYQVWIQLLAHQQMVVENGTMFL